MLTIKNSSKKTYIEDQHIVTMSATLWLDDLELDEGILVTGIGKDESYETARYKAYKNLVSNLETLLFNISSTIELAISKADESYETGEDNCTV